MLEVYKRTLPNWRYRLWPTDTRSIVLAVFFALGFTLTMQIAERLDTALLGGVAPFFGALLGTFWFTWGSMFLGLTGGLAVAWINPIVANLTATGPLAPFHFTFNTLYCVPMALFVRYFKPRERGFAFKEYLGLHMLASVLTMLPLIGIHLLFFGFPIQVAIFWYLFTLGAMLLHGVVLGWPVTLRLLGTGLIPGAEEAGELRT